MASSAPGLLSAGTVMKSSQKALSESRSTFLYASPFLILSAFFLTDDFFVSKSPSWTLFSATSLGPIREPSGF